MTESLPLKMKNEECRMKKGGGDERHRAYICATDNGTYVCSMFYLVIVKNLVRFFKGKKIE